MEIIIDKANATSYYYNFTSSKKDAYDKSRDI
jgi:hypothetical protein